MENPTQHIVNPKVFPFFCVLWFLPMVLAVVYYFVKNRGNLERAYICGILFGICLCIIYFALIIHIVNLEKQVAAGAASNMAAYEPGTALALILSTGSCFLLFYLLGPRSLALKVTRQENCQSTEEETPTGHAAL